MIVPDQKADAALGWLSVYALDMCADEPASLEPPPDPRLTGWTLVGYVLGLDAIDRSAPLVRETVCYGYVAQSVTNPHQFVIALRGTSNPIEWAEDAEFELMSAPGIPGAVECGFYGIANSLAFRVPGGADQPLIPALTALVGSGSLTIVGHSLGSALATIVAYQAAPALGGRVTLRVFASPRPGNADFTAAVAEAVPDHVHYANVLDLVPRVPFGFGYAPLPNTVTLLPHTGFVRIKFGPACLHHLVGYLALIDPDYVAPEMPVDQNDVACIVRVRIGD